MPINITRTLVSRGSNTPANQIDPGRTFGHVALNTTFQDATPNTAGYQNAAGQAMARAVENVGQDLAVYAQHKKALELATETAQQKQMSMDVQTGVKQNELDANQKVADGSLKPADYRQFVVAKNKITLQTTYDKFTWNTPKGAQAMAIGADVLKVHSVAYGNHELQLMTQEHNRTDIAVINHATKPVNNFGDLKINRQIMDGVFDSPGFISQHAPEEIARIKNDANSTLEYNFVATIVDTHPKDVPTLLKNPELTYLSPAQRDELALKAVNRLRVFDARDQAKISGSIALQIAGATLPTQIKTINTVIDQSILTDAQKANMKTRLAVHFKKYITQQNNAKEIIQNSTAHPGFYTTQTGAKIQKKIDDGWTVMQAHNKDLTPQQQAVAQHDYVITTGRIPTELKASIEHGLDSQDQTIANNTATIVNEYRINNPAIEQQLPKHFRAKSALLHRGLSVEKVDMILTNREKMSTEEKKISDHTVITELTNGGKASDTADIASYVHGIVNDHYDSHWYTFGSSIDVPAKLTAEYQKALTDEYRLTGNLDIAKTSALNDVLNGQKWGRTELDGHVRMMQYSPERMFNPSNNPIISDKIKQQYSTELKSIKVNADHVVLLVNQKSVNTNQVSYYLYDTTQGDTIRDKNNIPVQWFPQLAGGKK